MHPVIERFLDRPLSHKIAFWVVSFALVGSIFWKMLYAPVLDEHKVLDKSFHTLTSQINTEKRLIRNLGKFQSEVKELDKKLVQALRELPDEREIPDLLTSISDHAKEAGLEVSLFKPIGERKKEFYAEVPVMVEIKGTFHQVVTFFDEVGRLSRIVNINNIGFDKPKIADEKVDLEANCTATTFRYLDEKERANASPQGGGKKRKRKK